MTTENERAKDQARAQLESIIEMVAALNLDWLRLEELREEHEDLTRTLKEAEEEDADNKEGDLDIHDAVLDAREALTNWEVENAEELEELEKAAGECKDADDARERIQEDALSVQVRSDWHDPGASGEATEFQILLCTGGPAVKIEGDLSQYGEPESACIYYQDWFTKWEELYLTSDEEAAVLDYCRCFYFGE